VLEQTQYRERVCDVVVGQLRFCAEDLRDRRLIEAGSNTLVNVTVIPLRKLPFTTLAALDNERPGGSRSAGSGHGRPSTLESG
jgi:hypothetical protein